MHKEKIKQMAAGLFLLFLGPSVSGQTNDSLQHQLPEVTVVATRSEKDILEAGRSVTVLTRAELDKSVYTTLGELLSAQQGLYVVGNGQTPGANESLFLRGTNSNQTAVFIDGVRVNDVSTVNSTLDLSELPLHSVERIEIIRGAHSTLFGSSAIGGVVQIQTRKPGKTGLHGIAGVSGGLFNTGGAQFNPSLSAGYRWNNGIYLNANADRMAVKGIDATEDTVTDPGVYKHRDRDNWTKASAEVNAGYDGSKFNSALSYRVLSMKTDIDRAAYVDDDNYTLDFNRRIFSASADYKTGKKTELMLSAGYSTSTRDARNDSSQVDPSGATDRSYSEDHYKGESLNLEGLFKYQGKHLETLAGLDYSRESMRQENYYYSALYDPYIYEKRTNLDSLKPHSSTAAFFLQADLNGTIFVPWLSSFNLVAGLRYNSFDLQPSTDKENLSSLTFEINPSYKLSSSTIAYFTYSTGFNTPSLYQLYSNEVYLPFDGSASDGLIRGNPELKPETSTSLEFGLKQKTEKGFASISLFNSITKDQIDYIYMWNPSISIDSLNTDFSRDDYRGDRYVNIGKQTTYGIELLWESEITDWLKVRTNMSLLNGFIDFISSESLRSQTGANQIQLYSNGAFLENTVRSRGLTRRPSTARTDLIVSPTKKITSNLGITYVGSRNDVFYDQDAGPFGALGTKAVEDYTLVDFSIKYEMTKDVFVAIHVENLLNTHYSEINGFRTRGRGISARLSFRF